MPNELILICGGTSIQDGIKLDLWQRIVDKYTIGCNFMYNYFTPTILCYVDFKSFYEKCYEDLKKLPLIIGNYSSEMDKVILPNTISIPACNSLHYTRDLKEGVYSSFCGVYALTLAIYLLDIGTIYMLGCDYGSLNKEKDSNGKPLTHFYQGNIEHRGIGRKEVYNLHQLEKLYGIFRNESKVKIYNVSPQSLIPDSIFEKITYEDMFNKLDNNTYNQDELREQIERKLYGSNIQLYTHRQKIH